MRIAILGWGSLIWDPRNLAYDGAWQSGGPQLPLEFSRISSDGRLTLVIDPEHGEFVTTLYTTSSITNLEESIENLRKREGMPSTQNIGFINLINCETHTRQNADLTDRIRAWGRAKSYDAVIWTDLPPRFEINGEAAPFSTDAAVAYLQSLSGEATQKAREYINNAPKEVNTPVRRKIQATGWLNEGE